MHEFGLAESIIATTTATAQGRRVKSIDVEVSELAAVTGEELQFAFDELTRGKALEGARLNVTVLKAKFTCPGCGASSRPEFAQGDHHSLLCAKCGATAKVGHDNKVEVKLIEVD